MTQKELLKHMTFNVGSSVCAPYCCVKKKFQRTIMLSKLYSSHFIKAKITEDCTISFLFDRRCRKNRCWVFSLRKRTGLHVMKLYQKERKKSKTDVLYRFIKQKGLNQRLNFFIMITIYLFSRERSKVILLLKALADM